uniref:RRM domain-containing protein n=1 Tax=Nothobranchius furzeri TaxID=105023 RepID=A0A8C6Q1X7_NOTFU
MLTNKLQFQVQTRTSFLPDVLLPADPANAPSCLTHTPGTIIPNGIFVGRIGDEVDESDLRRVFSQYGEVKEVKIVSHRSGISKGYGFVTFETAEDAMRVLSLVSGRDRILRIARAIKRPTHMTPLGPAVPQVSCGTFVMSTSTGFPYTYNNGMAYFHCANVSPDVQFWPVSTKPPSLGCNFPNPYPWNTVEVPVPPGAVMYPQPSEYLYQPADGPLFLPFGPVWEDAPAEVQSLLKTWRSDINIWFVSPGLCCSLVSRWWTQRGLMVTPEGRQMFSEAIQEW